MASDPSQVRFARFGRTGFWAQLEEISGPLQPIDIIVFALIIGYGALQFFCVERSSEFLSEDVFFADSARSIAEHGFYGINGYAETNMPPGLPFIFAWLCLIKGCSHIIFLRVMVVCATLGFMAAYELLRHQAPRLVAAAICLLLISSRIHFVLVTTGLWPSYPYFFTATSALLVARKFEQATSLSRIGWGSLLTALIAASLMFASAGIAFLGAMVASAGAAFFRDRPQAFTRLRIYVVVLLVGIAVQGFWMHSQKGGAASAGISAQEWPLLGFPQSYLSQLKVKSGNYPELGMAGLSDIPARIFKSAYQGANLLSQMLLQRSLYVAWMSIVTIGVLLLIVLGWCYSTFPTGGSLQDWYFAGYEFIYLLWPWNHEPRFLLPVAPLACLYLWRGINGLAFLSKNKPRVLGAVWFPMALFLTVSSWFWMRGSGFAGYLPHAGFQDEASFLVWLLSAIMAGWMAWSGTTWLHSASAFLRWCFRPLRVLRINPLHIAKVFGILLLVGLIGKGLTAQIRIGRANLDLHSATNRLPPDAEAGIWIRSHTEPNAIVMARLVPTVYHFSNRKVVWFPPSSNPKLLMEGILKFQVDFLIVVRRSYSYYLPADDDCFGPLLDASPAAFHLVYQTPDLRIYRVIRNTRIPAST